MTCNKTHSLLLVLLYTYCVAFKARNFTEWVREKERIQKKKKEKNSPELYVVLWISFIFLNWNVWNQQHLYHQSCILNSLFFSHLSSSSHVISLFFALCSFGPLVYRSSLLSTALPPQSHLLNRINFFTPSNRRQKSPALNCFCSLEEPKKTSAPAAGEKNWALTVSSNSEYLETASWSNGCCHRLWLSLYRELANELKLFFLSLGELAWSTSASLPGERKRLSSVDTV